MDKKKTNRADLERKKGMFLQIGFVIALSVVFFAFEYKFYEQKIIIPRSNTIDIVEVLPPITVPEPPPPPKEPHVTDQMKIVIDDIKVEPTTIFNAEANSETEIKNIMLEPDPEIIEPEVFLFPEEYPTFKDGGTAGLKRYILENVIFPKIVKETGIDETVYLSFIIEPNGSVSTVEILRSIGSGCDKEAIRVIESLPKWNPGKQNGRPVRVKLSMPIKFKVI